MSELYASKDDAENAEQLVLVDEADRELGTRGKLAVHVEGALHRALSVYVFNGKGQLLLTRRSPGKYHSGGLWTNTCCSHPRPGEAVASAARRRLREEAGIDCDLVRAFEFIYRAELENGLIEHELDHVFVATFDGEPRLDPRESDAWEWADPPALARDIAAHPERYSAWLALSLEKAVEAQRIAAAGRVIPSPE
jgi:isopentenyl-diphosphate delta-isomerase